MIRNVLGALGLERRSASESLRKELKLINQNLDKIHRSLSSLEERSHTDPTLTRSILELSSRLELLSTTPGPSNKLASSDLDSLLRHYERLITLSKNSEIAIKKSIIDGQDNQFRQIESILWLQRFLDIQRPLPWTRGWAASPDFLLHIYTIIRNNRPKTVVELGSGVSTLVAAAALRENGAGQLLTLESDEQHAETTARLLETEELLEFAQVEFAPLEPWTPKKPSPLGEQWSWYRTAGALSKHDSIEVLIIDGPPQATGRFARFPAIPELRQKLARGALVVLDDARRPDEQAITSAWVEDYQMTVTQHRNYEKGLVEFRAF